MDHLMMDYVPEDEVLRIAKAADECGITVGQLLRRSVRLYMKDIERQKEEASANGKLLEQLHTDLENMLHTAGMNDAAKTSNLAFIMAQIMVRGNKK